MRDFAEVSAALLIAHRLQHLLERKNPVHDWLQLRERDRPVHLLKHLPRTDIDALQPDGFHQDRPRIHFALAGEDPDQRNMPAPPDRLDRKRQRSRAAHFDHVIHADAARESADRLIPFGRGFVIDQLHRRPSCRRRSSLASLHEVAITRAPAIFANCSAKTETPPLP